jgi:hypothetical protein
MARADGSPGGIQDSRAHGAGRGRRAHDGRARGKGASAGWRPSGSGTHNPRLNVLIAGTHSCSFVYDCANER